MRALVVHPGPSFSVADVYTGWCRGLAQLGVEVRALNLDDRLAFYTHAEIERDGEHVRALSTEEACRMAVKGVEVACYEWWPDLVVIISGFFLDDFVCEVIRSRGHKLVLVHTESPYEDDRQLSRAHLVDVNVLNDPTNLDKFPPGTVYLPHCYDPEIHRPLPAVRGLESEFFFAGSGYPSRIEFLEAVDWDGIDVALGGNWQALTDDSPLLPFLVNDRDDCMDNTDTAAHYASTLTSCNLYRVEANRPELSGGWAVGPREIELAACQRWFARQTRGEGDDLFPMLPTFTEPPELGELIRWALAHPDEREAAALKAREAVTDRTFDVNAARLLQLLDL